MLLLTEADVQSCLDMPSAIAAVEEVLRQFGAGNAVNVPRVRARAPGVVLHSMSAVASYLGLAAWKCYTTTAAGATFHVGLSDAKTGKLLALIEADRLGQIRTGAATAVAVKHLAAPKADQLGLFGTGWQAESQLRAIAVVRPLREVRVYSRNEERRRSFAERLSSELGIRVEAVRDPEDAVRDLPIIVTATSSKTPVFNGALWSHSSLLCAMGSNWIQKAEVDADAVANADRIVCDSVDACKQEAGELVQAAAAGKFDWSRGEELAGVVVQPSSGSSNGGRILFKSVGLAIEDVAVAAVVYRNYSL